MTPYISTITGNFGLFCLLSVCFPQLLFRSPPSASLALSLSFSALMSRAHCAESSVSVVSVLLALNSWDRGWDDKASFFLCAYYSSTDPYSRHYLTFIIPQKDGEEGRDEATELYGGGDKTGGEEKKFIKNWSCGWNASKRRVGCSLAHCTRLLGFVWILASSQNIFTFIDKINCWQNSWLCGGFRHKSQCKAANSRSQIISLLHGASSVKKSGRRMSKHFISTGTGPPVFLVSFLLSTERLQQL